MNNVDYDASRLLAEQRPLVEVILRKYGYASPPSQSYRTVTLLREMDKAIEGQSIIHNPEIYGQWVDRKKLRIFLATHTVVALIERRSRSEGTDPFGREEGRKNV